MSDVSALSLVKAAMKQAGQPPVAKSKEGLSLAIASLQQQRQAAKAAPPVAQQITPEETRPRRGGMGQFVNIVV